MFPFEQMIHEVARLETGQQPTLTLYLGTDPSHGSGADLEAQLAVLVRPVEERLAPADREKLAGEVALVAAAIRQIEPPPRGAAIFSCAALGFLRTVPLRVPMRPRIHWGHHFNLRPLIALLDEHERIVVLLLDKQRARIFRVLLGEIEELEDLWDYVPNKQRQGGYAQANIQRDHDMHVLAHVHGVTRSLRRVAAREKVDRVLVGGPEEVVALFDRALPKVLRSKVHTGLHVPLVATAAEVLRATDEVNCAIERESEIRLVRSLIEQTGRTRSTSGAAGVVDAVNGRRVHTLVVAETLRLEGYECDRCGALHEGPATASCPVCGGRVWRIPELVARLEDQVLRQDGRVEEVRGPAAALLDREGGIAARLRYAPAVEAPRLGAPS